MWISLIVALLAYFMSPRDTSSERKKALLTAVGAGALTYGVTEYTDWGKENLKPLDDKISGVFTGGSSGEQSSASSAEGSKVPATGDSGVWDTINKIGVPIAAAGAGALAATSLPSWVLWAGLAFLTYKALT